MAAGDLTTLEAAKRFVGVANSDVHDVLLRSLITSASAWLCQFCNRSFVSQSYTEVRNGSGGSLLALREIPVISVSSLVIDGLPVAASGYSWDRSVGGLYLIGGARFTRGIQNVTVVYTAGFATVPGDVDLFCQQIVAEVFRAKDRTGQSSVSLNGQTISFKDEDIPSFVKTGLIEGGWKRVVRP